MRAPPAAGCCGSSTGPSNVAASMEGGSRDRSLSAGERMPNTGWAFAQRRGQIDIAIHITRVAVQAKQGLTISLFPKTQDRFEFQRAAQALTASHNPDHVGLSRKAEISMGWPVISSSPRPASASWPGANRLPKRQNQSPAAIPPTPGAKNAKVGQGLPRARHRGFESPIWAPGPAETGPAWRSNLPCGVSGSFSCITISAGNMYSGSHALRWGESPRPIPGWDPPERREQSPRTAFHRPATERSRPAAACRKQTARPQFPQFHAPSANLYLRVAASKKIKLAIGPPAHPVACPIHPGSL